MFLWWMYSTYCWKPADNKTIVYVRAETTLPVEGINTDNYKITIFVCLLISLLFLRKDRFLRQSIVKKADTSLVVGKTISCFVEVRAGLRKATFQVF
jgi:hypothetical protein